MKKENSLSTCGELSWTNRGIKADIETENEKEIESPRMDIFETKFDYLL